MINWHIVKLLKWLLMKFFKEFTRWKKVKYSLFFRSTLWIREWMHIRPITLYKSCISIRTRKLPWCYNYQQVMLSQKLKFVFAAFQLREWESSGWFRILKLCPWKWEYDRRFAMHNMNEWTLNSRFHCFVYVAYIDVFFPVFQWYDIMTK